MSFIHSPHTFILISILVELNSETFLAVIAPVTDVLLGRLPHLTFDASILLSLLFLDPVDASVGSILLRFRVIAINREFHKTLSKLIKYEPHLHFPEMHELILWFHGLGVLQHCGVVALWRISN